ncbi:MAG: hypothetical protein VB018_13165 [Lachnospiraceae bacterium]|nr:hypothetical protein [Lachnospiraceae bacterium]
MIEKALRYVVGLRQPQIETIDGITYCDKDLSPVFAPRQSAVDTKSLLSVVDYIKANIDGCILGTERVVIHIKDYQSVNVMSESLIDSKEREQFIHAKAELPAFRFGNFYTAEEFNILMQSVFIENDDAEILLKVVGNLKDSAVKAIGDDGVSQSVTMKVGISTVADVKVPNPVSLMPYRTFIEVDQPESKFIFRMREGGMCALFEADGGAWKRNAVIKIKEYFEFELAAQIDAGNVIILA